jgi:hypothetical protein
VKASGFEPETYGLRVPCSPDTTPNDSNTSENDPGAVDRALTTAKRKLPDYPPDLARVMDLWAELPEPMRLALARWPELAEPIRAAILALAGTAGKYGGNWPQADKSGHHGL